MKLIRKLIKDEKGATAIEYGLIAALVSIAAVGALSSMGDSLKGTFDNVKTELDKGAAAAPATP